MMDITQIKKIISESKENGYEIKIRDIAFALLSKYISDNNILYQIIYQREGDQETIDNYVNSETTKFIKGYLENIKVDNIEISEVRGLSYDENRKGMEADLIFLEKFIETNGKELDAKEIAAIMGKKADLRVKLNDKFGVTDKTEEQKIIVQTKFSGICDWLHKECPMTKDYVKNKFNLIEKNG